MGYINSKLFPNFVVGDFSPVCVMGVVNLSPESFFKDSYVEKNSLTKKCNAFISNGAKILDLGARSTAPWSKKISLAEECERIELALDSLPKIIPSDVAVSIDTQYSKVAELALERAQEKDLRILINDVSSFTTDKKLLDVVTDFDCPCVIMATE